MDKLYLGVDLGGTNIAAGIVNKNGEILFKKSVRTNLPKTEKEIEQKMFELCKALCGKNNIDIINDVKAIGIGTPGSVNSKTGIVGFNANFGYKNWRLKDNMQELFSCPVFVENDANAAILAEITAGSAKGYKDAIIITLGTGVGGGIVIGGKVFSGSNNMGTEIGHMAIVFDGKACKCGRKGCFEQYASASALAQQAKDEMNKDKSTLLWSIAKSIDKVNAKTVFDAMRQGDKVAEKLIARYIKYLACGVINVINIFQPEIICIGGGVSSEKDNILAPLKNIIDKEEYARDMQKRTKITTAKFKNDAGIIGAALLGVNND